jgi:hypothetical protein
MLNEIEVLQYYSKLSEHFIDKSNNIINLKTLGKFFCLISPTNRLVSICSHPMTSRSLGRFTLNYSQNVIRPYHADLFLIKNQSWKIQTNNDAMGFVKILWTENLNFESTDVLHELILLNQKSALLDEIHMKIDYYRSTGSKFLYGQEQIYFFKYIEAKEIIENNIVVDTMMKYPFTTGYCEIMDISLQEAAKQIMFQHENECAMLSGTENLRIRYTNIVRNETDITKLQSILENFNKEHILYSVI